MLFNHFLSAYYPDTSYGGHRLFRDMIAQGILADQLGYSAVTIPEHHLINILLTPSPLQMAVRVAAETRNIDLVTSVSVLPIHDMRIFAGEVSQADNLTDGRLVLGVGRGAFRYELERLGVDMEQTREIFDESLMVLEELLTKEEASWDGTHYQFEQLTIMPRPYTKPMPRIMIAALAPTALYHCARRGFNVQTTVLQHDRNHLLEQVQGFQTGKAERSDQSVDIKLSMLQVGYLAKDQADADEKIDLAHDYYKRFDNVFTGPGIVSRGAIEPLPRQQTRDELAANLLICTRDEMIDHLSYYKEAGIDEITLNPNIGASQDEVLEQMNRMAAEVFPALSAQRQKTGSVVV